MSRAASADYLPFLSVNGRRQAHALCNRRRRFLFHPVFLFNFDRRQAGLGGVAFEEGEFSTFGYVTKGLDYVKGLRKAILIVKASVEKGDRLVNPSISEADRIEEIRAAAQLDKKLEGSV